MQLPDLFGVRKLTAQVAQLQLSLQTKAMSSTGVNNFTNFNTQIFPHYNILKEEFIYQIMDDIYSVVSRLATTAAGIPFKGCKQDGSELPKNDPLNKFLKTLTFEQKEQFYTSLYLSGEVFAYKEKIEFGVNKGVQSLQYLLPANMVVIISQDFPTKIVGYRYYDSFNGYTKDFGLDEIMFIKKFNPTRDIQLRYRGFSAVTALKNRLVRVQSELDISVAQMQNGGLPGIVYEKTPGVEVGASGQRKDNFARFLGNSSNKGAPYFSNGDLGYLAIGSTLADMSLAELAQIDFDKVCNAFSVSSILWNSKDASTHSNVGEMRKDMFTNAVLPEVTRIEDGLNSGVVVDIPTAGIVCKDTSGISELKEDIKNLATAYGSAPVIIPNDVLEAMGSERSSDPMMDEPMFKSGYTSLEDMKAPPELANTAADYVPPVTAAKKGAKVECPKCYKQTSDTESGMGYIICENCKEPFKSGI